MARIRFGIKSMKLKSFSTEDFNLTQPDFKDCELELRQRYFHISFIPVFSVGKFWQLKKGNALIDIDQETLSILNQQKNKYKTPWYIFLFPILAITIIIGYFTFEYLRDVKRETDISKGKMEEVEILRNSILNSTTNDYWCVRLAGTYDFSLLRYHSKNDSVIKFISLRNRKEKVEPSELYGLFKIEDLVDTITFNLDTLMQFKVVEINDYSYPDILFGSSDYYYEYKITIDKPEIVCINRIDKTSSDLKLNLFLANKGMDCQIDSINILGTQAEISIDYQSTLNYGTELKISNSSINQADFKNISFRLFYSASGINYYSDYGLQGGVIKRENIETLGTN